MYRCSDGLSDPIEKRRTENAVLAVKLVAEGASGKRRHAGGAGNQRLGVEASTDPSPGVGAQPLVVGDFFWGR